MLSAMTTDSAAQGPWWQASALGLAEAFRTGAATPVDALLSCLARIDRMQPELNAFVAQRRDAAMHDALASAARWRSGQPLSPLDGVPIAIKDNLPTFDLPTTWGCRALAGHQPAADELVVARARAAGLVIIGKTNVPEYTLEGYTGNALFGVTRNPWNTALTPGGSSGGNAAAVASGCVPLAIGTDGGGSIRRPCSHTGLFGLKPSLGAIPRVDTLPPILLDFEVAGPMARTAADVKALFEVLRGPDPRDPASMALPRPDNAAAIDGGALRVLYVPTLDGAPVDPDIARLCRAHAEDIAAKGGHTLTVGEMPLDLTALNAGWPLVGQMGLAWMFEQHPDWRAGTSAKYLAMAEEGARQPATRLWTLQAQVAELRQAALDVFEGIDVIITPAAAAQPWAADTAFPDTIDGQPVGPRGHAIFTGWVNAAGLPAVALPSGLSPAGMPMGIQCIAAHGRDELLLALGGSVPPSTIGSPLHD